MSERDGGPAFPIDGRIGWNEHGTTQVVTMIGGMSLRDWFAGQVPVDAVEFSTIKGAAAFIGEDPPTDDEGRIRLGTRVAAKVAYMYADAMLEAREES